MARSSAAGRPGNRLRQRNGESMTAFRRRVREANAAPPARGRRAAAPTARGRRAASVSASSGGDS